MRRILRPLLLPLLRRADDEVEVKSRAFSIATERGRFLVASVGRSFLGGYHAMLRARSLDDVREAGGRVAVHFQPFFFEGAAMGYLPRAYYTPSVGPETVERDLLAMDPRFLYLYYVGLGFWHGFRHPRRPEALEGLARHLDPFYVPLCYDGFGFKLAFFDYPSRPSALRVLDRAPANRRAAIHQGFGRALFFVCMDDEDRFSRIKSDVSPEHRADLESGRSLAVAFTGLDEPRRIFDHLHAAKDQAEAGLRLLGVTWALTARQRNDDRYFERCLAGLPDAQARFLRGLPKLCLEAEGVSSDYREWRETTQAAAVAARTASEEVLWT